MRKSAVALAAMIVLGLAAVAYAQGVENTYSVEASTSPTRAGSSDNPVPVGVKFAYQVGEVSGLRPSPIKHYSIRFAGLRANTQAFPTCSLSTLEDEGVDGCRDAAIVGEGFIRNATGATDNPADKSVPCNARLWVINGGRGRAYIYVKGSPTATSERERCSIDLAAPIPARFVQRGRFQALEFEVPASLLHPLPTLTNAVTDVESTIKRVTRRFRRKRVGFFESRGGCRRGKREIQVVFTAENGDRTTARTNARCRS